MLRAGSVVAARREGKADETFHVETGLRDLAAIGAVVVESIEYTGRGREKPRSRVYLSRELGKPPVHGAAKDIRLSQDDAITGLYEVLPWPRNFSWRIGKDGHLIVTAGGKTLTLKPGETGSLPPLSAEVGLRIEEIVIGPGEDPELLVEEKDYGKIRFGTEISIRYLGRMPIKEVQR